MSDLLRLIKDFVDLDGPWKDKRDRLLQQADEDERIALFEFISWFPEEE